MGEQWLTRSGFEILPVNIGRVGCRQFLERQCLRATPQHDNQCHSTAGTGAGGIVHRSIQAQARLVGTVPEAYLPQAGCRPGENRVLKMH